MSNDYYNHGSYPSTGAAGSSAAMRAELDAVTAGFNKMPVLAGAAGRLVIVNAGATALDSTTVISISGTTVTFTGNVTGIINLTTTGSTSLGDAAADTLTVSGNVVKGSAGNWTLPAPTSGSTLAIASFGTSPGLSISSAVANDAQISLAAISYARDWRMQALNATGAWNLRDATRGADVLSASVSGNVTIAAPSSGQALTVLGASSGSTASFGDAAANGGFISLRRAGTTDYGYIGNSAVLLSGSNTDLAIRAETGAFLVSTGGASTRVIINSAGNIVVNAPSTGTALTINTTQPNGITVTTATAAFANTIAIVNSDNTSAASQSSLFMSVGGSSSGDNFIRMNIIAVQDWTFGVDNSDSDAFVISASNTLGTSNTLRISTAGNVTTAAPSSGTALTVSGLAGARTLQINSASSSNAVVSISAVGTRDYHLIANNSGQFIVRDDTGATDRITLSSAGNVTINAPTSGVGFTQTGFAGSDTAIFNGGTSGSFRVTDRGLPYGTSIHNNAGSVTGTTNQYFASGTYTPTFTAVTNSSSPTVVGTWKWSRLGNTVTFSGSFTSTAAGTGASSCRVTLPIASAIAATSDVNGSGGSNSSGDIAVRVIGDATNDAALVNTAASPAGSREITVIAQYEVL